jgi:oxygen-independent coproporphyrinogen-3 oxidase
VTPDLVAKYDSRVPRYTSYPTAPHFEAGVDEAAYRRWLRELPDGSASSIYLHVPFCASLCWYCGCHTRVVRGYEAVGEYVGLLEREMALVAEEAAGLRAAHIHWGGGTPNMLDADDLARLMERLKQNFAVVSAAEVSAELDPRLLTPAQVRGLAAAGVTRASLGVQDFNPAVQRAINRVQPFEMTQHAVGWLRAAGIRGINFDLMYGLPLQTEESVLATVDRAATLEPDRVALFGYAHVPWLKKHQLLLPEHKLPGPADRVRQFDAAARRLVEHGYVHVGLDHFALPHDPMAQRLEEGGLRRNFQGYTDDGSTTLIGLGVSAIGTLPQGYVQNTTDVTLYRERLREGRLATARGRSLTGEDRLRRDVIERLMCDLAVDLDALARRHQRSPAEFDEALAALDDLVADGIAAREGWRVEVTEAGRPLVRSVCAVFDAYLSKDAVRHARAL